MANFVTHYRESFAHLQRNIWILSIAMFINRSGSMVLLFTSLYLTNELHFSISEAGVVLSFYGIGSILGSYAGGWLTDRRNHFDIMMASLISSGLILLVMLLISTKILIILVIFFYAFTADMFRPANSAAIAVYSDPENRTRSVSLVRLAVNLGFSVGPAIGGFIAYHLGYKWLFAIDAFTSFAAAVMLYYYLPRKKEEHNKHKNNVLSDSSTSAYRDYRYLTFILLVALYGMCFFQLFASIPQFFSRDWHYNEDTIGLILALNGLLVVVIEMPLIAAIQKTKNIFPFIIAGTLCIPVSFMFLMLGQDMLLAVIYTFIITMAEILAMPFMMNYALSRALPERQGQYSALYSISFGLANIAAPAVGLGLASAYGFNVMFSFFIVISVLIAAGFALLSRREQKNNLIQETVDK
jgi:predicted MFS family arabinose efflux permease